ncbi:hypothetical protein LEP1GSC168_0802 [Leptospira santarosai str. HAI134]|nr:hypothetical protein LEP1GSC168_0802 [Leptospira santarosai str. HAI134]
MALKILTTLAGKGNSGSNKAHSLAEEIKEVHVGGAVERSRTSGACSTQEFNPRSKSIPSPKVIFVVVPLDTLKGES